MVTVIRTSRFFPEKDDFDDGFAEVLKEPLSDDNMKVVLSWKETLSLNHYSTHVLTIRIRIPGK